MSYITIPSVLHPTERAYKLSSGSLDHYNKRGERCLFDHITQYETYGDGTCQHSGDWCAQFHELEDVCLSFATAMLADPKNPEWENLRWFMQGFFKKEDIRFAFTVKYKDDGKNRYYSKQECKVAMNKEHDRRFERIESWADGSAEAVFHLLWLRSGEAMDWLTRVRLAVEIAEVCQEINGYWANPNSIFAPLKELGEGWDYTFRIFADMVKATSLLRQTEHTLTIIESNRANRARIEAEKAPAAATPEPPTIEAAA